MNVPLASSIDGALARIAAALHVPVLLLALLALLACALESGAFLTEWLTRRRAGHRALLALARRALEEPAGAVTLAREAPSRAAGAALLGLANAASAGEPLLEEAALADFELSAQRRLDRTRLLVRAGPALGLMGTLIPLAPGLTALSHGDVATLATDLRTAFAATTVGLLVGTGAFGLTLMRTRLYDEDLAQLERAVAAGKPG